MNCRRCRSMSIISMEFPAKSTLTLTLTATPTLALTLYFYITSSRWRFSFSHARVATYVSHRNVGRVAAEWSTACIVVVQHHHHHRRRRCTTSDVFEMSDADLLRNPLSVRPDRSGKRDDRREICRSKASQPRFSARVPKLSLCERNITGRFADKPNRGRSLLFAE